MLVPILDPHRLEMEGVMAQYSQVSLNEEVNSDGFTRFIPVRPGRQDGDVLQEQNDGVKS